jgi:hypothetical protein
MHFTVTWNFQRDSATPINHRAERFLIYLRISPVYARGYRAAIISAIIYRMKWQMAEWQDECQTYRVDCVTITHKHKRTTRVGQRIPFSPSFAL